MIMIANPGCRDDGMKVNCNFKMSSGTISYLIPSLGILCFESSSRPILTCLSPDEIVLRPPFPMTIWVSYVRLYQPIINLIQKKKERMIFQKPELFLKRATLGKVAENLLRFSPLRSEVAVEFGGGGV